MSKTFVKFKARILRISEVWGTKNGKIRRSLAITGSLRIGSGAVIFYSSKETSYTGIKFIEKKKCESFDLFFPHPVTTGSNSCHA